MPRVLTCMARGLPYTLHKASKVRLAGLTAIAVVERAHSTTHRTQQTVIRPKSVPSGFGLLLWALSRRGDAGRRPGLTGDQVIRGTEFCVRPRLVPSDVLLGQAMAFCRALLLRGASLVLGFWSTHVDLNPGRRTRHPCGCRPQMRSFCRARASARMLAPAPRSTLVHTLLDGAFLEVCLGGDIPWHILFGFCW